MEKTGNLKDELNKRKNQNEGLTISALICGIIAIGATIGAIVPEIAPVPALQEIQQGLISAASTSALVVAPILTIKGINSGQSKLLRKIGGLDKNSATVGGLTNSNTDCAILEINERENKKRGIHQAVVATAFIAGIAGLGIVLADKDLPKILEFISKLKDEFKVAVITAIATIVAQLSRIIKINTEVNLIENTFSINDDAIEAYNVRNGQRGARRKTLKQRIMTGANYVSGIFRRKGKE